MVRDDTTRNAAARRSVLASAAGWLGQGKIALIASTTSSTVGQPLIPFKFDRGDKVWMTAARRL